MSELLETPEHRDAVTRLETKMIDCGQLRSRSEKPPADFTVQPRANLNGRDNSKPGKYVRHRLSAAAASVYRQPEVEIRRQTSLKTSADDCDWPLAEHQPRASRVSCNDFNGAEYMMWSHVEPSDTTHDDDDDGGRPRPASLAVPRPLASLASELRARLATGAPILLPPKDYDTLSRSRGNLYGIEERRCVNVDIVGGDRTARRTPQTYL